MPEPDPTAPAKVRRRRGKELENAILEAAWTELAERGWTGFTMEGVAIRAGSGKAPIYQRWPNRTALLRAALFGLDHGDEPWTPTGENLRDDLLEDLQRLAAKLASPFGQAIRALIAAAGENPETGNIEQHPIPTVMAAVRAAAEHEQPTVNGYTIVNDPGSVPPAVVNLGPQMVTLDFLANGHPATPKKLEEIVDLLWLPLLIQHLATPQR